MRGHFLSDESWYRTCCVYRPLAAFMLSLIAFVLFVTDGVYYCYCIDGFGVVGQGLVFFS